MIDVKDLRLAIAIAIDALEEVAEQLPEPKPEAEEDVEPVKRMTIIIGEPLHRRIKASCATRGIDMVDAIREVLERASWPTSEAA
jgi:predicted DNA binding CopG/RHH family protein